MDKSSSHETLVEDGHIPPHNLEVDSRGKVRQRVRDALEALGVSQKAFCEQSGENYTKFNNYLNDSSDNMIPPEVASKLCDEFGLTLDWIYRGRLSHLLPADFSAKFKQLEHKRATKPKIVAQK